MVPQLGGSGRGWELNGIAQNKSNLPHKQLNEFVPLAFVNDSMVILVKTEENEAETSGTKHLDLKPMNHGYIYICTKDTPDKRKVSK